MIVIVCPDCGRENRSALRASTCDHCGADISLLAAPATPTPAASPPPAEAPAPATKTPSAPEPPAPAARSKSVSVGFLGRSILAIVAVAVGLYAGLILRCGSALSLDSNGAGAVAVLAAALAISGVVLLLSGSGVGAQRVAAGLRVLGLILAVLGTTVVIALIQKPAQESRPYVPAGTVVAPQHYSMGPMGPGGPGMYPRGASPTAPGRVPGGMGRMGPGPGAPKGTAVGGKR